MSFQQTIFWHDYETFGTIPKVDRPAQFAGIRTDLELNILEESPVTLYCRPADDYLPNPEACLVTGITPQKCLQEGVSEFEFISRINGLFSVPGTCGAGYNSLRFDDEFTRYTLFRNLFDPYAREWRNGNSRWDLIDLVRLVYVLKPDALTWPVRDDGEVSFRLDQLTVANHIEHGQAHDAMADVYATIALARLIRTKCRELYDMIFDLRGKRAVEALVQKNPGTFLHVSGKYPASLGSCAIVYPLGRQLDNPNALIVYDLREDPCLLADLDADEIRRRVFTSTDELAREDISRIPLKSVHLNRCPILLPANILRGQSKAHLEKLGLNGELLRKHRDQLSRMPEVIPKVQKALSYPEFPEESDPEYSLYSGGFLSDTDRRAADVARSALERNENPPDQPFEDGRLPELLLRLKGRSFPHLLSPEEHKAWEAHRADRLLKKHENGLLDLETFFRKLHVLANEKGRTQSELVILEELKLFGESLVPYDY